MHKEMTNLLPSARQEQLVREYRFRFGVVTLSLCISLVIVAGTLLIPTYVFLQGSVLAKESRLATIKSTLTSANEIALSARLTALANDTATLVALSGRSSTSEILRSVLAVSRPGVTLSGFSYTAGIGKTGNTLALSGIAATRDALRSYQLALQSAPLARRAELPVSAYAKDTNIAFTITLTLAL
jgi:Tfp pilus assembly protein PilN